MKGLISQVWVPALKLAWSPGTLRLGCSSFLLLLLLFFFLKYLFIHFTICIGSQLWHQGSSLCCSDFLVVAQGLSNCGTQPQLPDGMWDLSYPVTDGTCVPCIARQILNHGADPGSSLLLVLNFLFKASTELRCGICCIVISAGCLAPDLPVSVSSHCFLSCISLGSAYTYPSSLQC